jgi:lysine 2,3-aminomutase
MTMLTEASQAATAKAAPDPAPAPGAPLLPLRPLDGATEVDLDAPPRDDEHKRFATGPFWQRLSDFAAVDEAEFASYPFQLKHALSNATPAAAAKLVDFARRHAGAAFAADVERGLAQAPMAVQLTPYIQAVIDWDDPYGCPVRRQFLPVASGLLPDHPMVALDSLGERHDAKTSSLVHRYHDRVLFLPQTTCPVYCRFCTRSYAVGTDTETVSKHKIEGTPRAWEEAFAYLRATPQVEDVVISGGDCYNLHARFIDVIADNLLAMDGIRRIRIATKGLAVNPGRIVSDARWTDAVIRFVTEGRKRGKQVVIHTHFNSPEEITWMTRDALRVLHEAGVIVRNQSVLLRGVNDSVQRMGLLVKRLGYLQIQPYYVYQHDLVRGVEDLRTSLATCLAIEHGIRGLTAGFNTPQFVVDAPGGGGKRIASTFDDYDQDTGISVYSAPAVKTERQFLYFDPLHALEPDVAERWLDPAWQRRACDAASVAAEQRRSTFRVRRAGAARPSLHS